MSNLKGESGADNFFPKKNKFFVEDNSDWPFFSKKKRFSF